MKAAVKRLSGMHGVKQKAIVHGKQVTVKMDTTSSISKVKLGEAEVSFDVTGKKGARGVAEISIGTIAKGPYQVTIGGKAAHDFKASEDRMTSETLLSINYGHDVKHRVAITGL